MSVLENISVDMSIVLGSTQLPIRQILKMSRGAMIAFDSGQDDPTQIFVNGTLVAKGRVLVEGERMSVEITEVLPKGMAI
ncbi:FliM/FliN family flagellar motor switch protein [Stakelama pacifica]|uniref:Flagellar motor switch protein FliN n=1 Tax=Stakelama pacifica TaxID=517720 RepID=A0A4R6FIB3_9SPHN|nr:FliM/FliN family flagellar motor switch protein [Stakelama pacifica]MAX01191.1 flagellar motor switch protein FliN [Sphingomonas sp.]TDN81132.1 flagellar motor switch protein FliN/FliY [Stakelama pacifica]GGO96849.1 hypothetical protein GCM10011329_24310 [Stakelama pacifica]